MNNYRHKIDTALLRGLCWLNSKQSPISEQLDLYQVRVLSGPLKGMYFAMPRLERLAFGLGTYEQHIVQVIQSYVKPGSVAYDIGANAGYLTLVMAQSVGRQGDVFAFEPDPKNIMALEANGLSNGLSNVSLIAKAVSEKSGRVSFATFDYSLVGHIARSNTSGDATMIEVDSISIDDYVYRDNNPAPNFIKIDVEGGEEEVLKGCSKVLLESKPIILAEVRAGQMWNDILRFMVAHNYTSQAIEGGWQMEQDGLGDILFLPAS
jgi:FkbM family methyltransferase